MVTKVPSPRTLVLDGSLGFCIVAIVEERDGVINCVAEDYNSCAASAALCRIRRNAPR